MIEGPFVRTGVQQRRMHQPTSFGMHPEAARNLALRGVDPEAFARRVEAARGGTFDVGNLQGFSLGQQFHGPASAAQPFGAPSPLAAFGAQTGHDPRLARFMAELPGLPYDRVSARFRESFGLDPGDTLVPQLLTQAALEWKNFDTLHTRVCPVQLETVMSGQYFSYDRAGQRVVVDSRIGPNGQVREVSRRVGSQLFSTEPRALSGRINRLAQAVAPTLNQMSSETEFVMSMHDREQERDVALALLTPGNYPAGNVVTLGAGYQWNGGGSADPVQNMLDLQLAIPATVNHCVFSDVTWSAAQVNEQLQEILFGRYVASNGILQPANFAQFFGVENVWISKHLIEDATGAVSRTWGETDVWMGHVNTARDSLTSTRRFRTSLGGNNGVAVRTSYDPDGAMGSDKVWVTRMDSAPYFVGADFAGVIRNVRRAS